MSDTLLLRIGIAVALSLLFGAIIYFGRAAGRAGSARRPRARTGLRPGSSRASANNWRTAGAGPAQQEELALDARPQAELGKRVSDDFDRIVSLYVAAKAGSKLRGRDIVVAAEGGPDLRAYGRVHRLVDGKPELGPIFSVANIIKPGSFDAARIAEVETPAIAFFLTLPAPCRPLDAWETMEPGAAHGRPARRRGAGPGRNALGAPAHPAHPRELRHYDRQNAAPPLRQTHALVARHPGFPQDDGSTGSEPHDDRHRRAHRRTPPPHRGCQPALPRARRPDLTDADYDALVRELEALDAHPELADAAPPTTKVGAAPPAASRRSPMWCRCCRWATPSATRRWPISSAASAKRLDRDDLVFSAEPKLDGLAISLRHEGGAFCRARPAAMAPPART